MFVCVLENGDFLKEFWMSKKYGNELKVFERMDAEKTVTGHGIKGLLGKDMGGCEGCIGWWL